MIRGHKDTRLVSWTGRRHLHIPLTDGQLLCFFSGLPDFVPFPFFYYFGRKSHRRLSHWRQCRLVVLKLDLAVELDFFEVNCSLCPCLVDIVWSLDVSWRFCLFSDV